MRKNVTGNIYLTHALEWIREQEPDNYIFARVLHFSLAMPLEDVNDYLAAFGVPSSERAEIIEAIKEEVMK